MSDNHSFQLSKKLDFVKGKVQPACLPPRSGLIIVNKLFIKVIFRPSDIGPGFYIEGKKAAISGWGGTIDKANNANQNDSCDLLKAYVKVKPVQRNIFCAIPFRRWT